MKCSKCGSEKTVPAFIGWFCHDCNQFTLVDEMRDQFTESLIERYSDNPPEHNKPGQDGVVDEKGKIVEEQ